MRSLMGRSYHIRCSPAGNIWWLAGGPLRYTTRAECGLFAGAKLARTGATPGGLEDPMLRRLLVCASLPLLLAGNLSAAPRFRAPLPPRPIEPPAPICDSTYKADDGTTICLLRDAAGNVSSVTGTDASGLKR